MRKKYIIALLILFIATSFLLAIGATYAVWTTTNVQEKENVINVGCFKITFKDTGFTGAGDINLSNDYPVSDSKGANKTPYKFSIKNECSIAANYAVQLETLTGSDMDTSYLKVKLDSATPVIYKTGFTNVSSDNYGLGNNTVEAKQLSSGMLLSGEEKVYELRVWIDYSAETTTPNVMGSTWLGKVVVLSEATPYVESGVTYSGEGEKLSTFLEENNIGTFNGPSVSNYILFNNELWRIGTSIPNQGNAFVRSEPLDDYTFDYANLDSYTTSPFIKTVGGETINYYDTLTNDAKAMIGDYPYSTYTISDPNVSVVQAYNGALASSKKIFKVFMWPVINIIFTNSDTTCNDYNFSIDVGTNRCVGTTYMLGGDYIYTGTKGPNGNYYIASRAGIKEMTTETGVKIKPAVATGDNIYVTGGSGTISDPYTLELR